VILVDPNSGIDNSSIELRVDGILRNHTYNATEFLLSWVPLTPFSDGDVVNIELEAKDNAGNRMDTYKWSFTVDGSPPTVSNPNPSNGSFINDNLTSILVNINDSVSGLNLSSITFKINDTTYDITSPELTWAAQILNFTPQTAFDECLLNITLDAKDNASNRISPSYNWLFFIDVSKPQLSNPYPSNNSYINIKRPNITIRLLDNYQINESSIILNVDGIDYYLSSILTYNNATGLLNFTPSSDFSEGAYIPVFLNAKDYADNSLDTYNFGFTIDTIIPTITILSPISKTYTTTNIWINFTCSDINWDATWYRIYNTTDSAWWTSNNITWTNNILLQFDDQKTYRIYAWVNDSAGNTQNTNVSVQFSIDIPAPAITIISPQNQSYGLTNINIIVDNSSSTTAIDHIWFRYSINSAPFSDNYSFYWNGSYWLNDTITFTEGSIQLIVYANNSANTIAISEVWFTIDLSAPTINIIKPTEGAILANLTNFYVVDVGSNDSDIQQIIIQYDNIGSWNNYAVWILGANLTWNTTGNNIFQINTRSLSDGNTYKFRCIAVDRVPNDGYSSIGFTQALTVDNTPPDLVEIISITDDSGGIYPGYYDGVLSIQYNANDQYGIYSEVELFDQSGWILNSTNNPIQWSTGTSDDGIHQLWVKVYDLAGNSNISSINIIIIDNSVPNVPTIDNITDDAGHDLIFGYFNGNITVQFTASDTVSGVILVQLYEGVNLIAVNNTANTIVFDSTNLSDGDYNLYIIAVDKCLNIRSSSQTPIKIDNTNPIMTDKVSNLLFEVEDTSQYIFWKVSDLFPRNYTIYSITNATLDEGSWASETDITYNLGTLTAGNRSYRIVVNDSVGNEIEDTVWVCVQNNTIKAGSPYNTLVPDLFNGIEITITSDLPGNLTISEQSDPSGGTIPAEYLNVTNIFVNISFYTDYSGINKLSVNITIYLDQQTIEDNNIAPETIKIAYWDEAESKWALLNTQFDSSTYSITANIDHLSFFAVFGMIESGGDGGFPLRLLIIVIVIIGAIAALLAIVYVSRRSKGKPKEIKPSKKGKKGDTEKLILERDSLIDKAEESLNKGEIKEAIRYFERIGNISRELGEFELYNQCVEKVKELRASLLKTIGVKPEEAPPGEVPIPITEEKEIQVLRGGEVVGDKIIYKVKIQNNSQYNITDVTVFLISYPRECMGLTTKETRSTPKIESGGYRSLEFEFEPHKDCVEGTVHASVTYIDHLNQSHTESVNPFTIRSVCDLLKPYRVREEEFDNMVLAWQKTGEFKKVNLNIYNLFERSKITLERHNFSIVSSKLYETEDSILVRGLIKAFAEGKYGKKKIGMLVEMMGSKDGELAQIRTSSTSEDEGMMASPISEVIEDFSQAGLSLDNMSPQEQEEFIKEKSLQSLRYLLVLHKEAGVTIYSVNFSEQTLDADLVSGFLSAISSFGMELSGGQSIGIRKMEYESLKIVLQQGNYVNVGLILDDFPENWLDLRLKTFVKALETQYKQHLENWTGDMRPYRTIGQLFAKIFEIQE
jgi:hypothetical protein